MAMFCARITFLAVIGKNAPAFTVASLAMIITRRPATRAEAGHQSRPRARRPIPRTSRRRRRGPARRKRCSGSISRAMRSRAVSRPFLCCDSMAARAAALVQLGLFVLDLGEEIHHAASVLLEVGRVAVDVGFDDWIRQRSKPHAIRWASRNHLSLAGCKYSPHPGASEPDSVPFLGADGEIAGAAGRPVLKKEGSLHTRVFSKVCASG